MNRRILLWAFGALAFSHAAVVGCATDSADSTRIGANAPQFSLPASNGPPVSLESYAGKAPVLLYFHMAYR
jgi:hypothetical protein